MIFSSSIFIFLFLPIVLFVYYGLLLKSKTLKNLFLFASSLVFYAWGEPLYVLLMLLSIYFNWQMGYLIAKYEKNKAFLVISVVVNIAVLFVFKYLSFVMGNVSSVFHLSLDVPVITLPIGISFFTFQAMSYTIDVYRDKSLVQKNPINVGLYISLFPQLIAGPIVRYETIAHQINHRKENLNDFSLGLVRFVIGLSKKVILANNFAVIADNMFNYGGELSVASAWLGALAYSLQILFDFLGYSDMAMGLGKMFGFTFLENFNYPYISTSISEFWRRWHISLGSWFRDYVYFPLGGSRVKSRTRLIFNLFVTWSLTGIWHGANWTFVVWGLIYFVLITAEKLTGFEKKDKKIIILRRIYTLLFVMLGWVIFRAESLALGGKFILSMFGVGANGFIDPMFFQNAGPNITYLLAGIILSTPIAKVIKGKFGDKKIYSVVYVLGTLLLFMVSVSFIAKGSYNPFIYFNF